MGAQLLKLHWKAVKWVLLPFAVAAFGLPIIGGRGAWAAGRTDFTSWSVLELSQVTGFLYPTLAALVGAVVALTAWNWDHQTNHVYALSLPVSRVRYTGMKFLAGLVILSVPTFTMLAGGLLSAALVELPAGLRAYPLDISLHFFLACATSFAFLFALAAGTMRTAVIVLGSIAGLIVFGPGTVEFAGEVFPELEVLYINQAVVDFLIESPGPLKAFTGSWSFIDV